MLLLRSLLLLISCWLSSVYSFSFVSKNPNIQQQFYDFHGQSISYRVRPGSNQNALLLIHPVGIGLSSWFWERFLKEYRGDEPLYATNLLGCGQSEQSALWQPNTNTTSNTEQLPWVEQCEAFLETIRRDVKQNNFLARPTVTVITQGGLATVGVLLASRNPKRVSKLVLASPPTWNDMTTINPKFESNFRFLTSPIGQFALNNLETRWAVALFSNLFLFGESCDDQWLDRATKECGAAVRPSVELFNAGHWNQQSYKDELCGMLQPTVVLTGSKDKRPRDDYQAYMKSCSIVTLDGQNVLPWENPSETCRVVQRILQQ